MPGQNNIRQSSKKSSITIPYERTFRPVGAEHQPTDPERLAAFKFCGCGWPEHMLLPRGKPEGMTVDLFVMISDYNDDAVVQSNENPDLCADSSSFCGLKDKLYPDNRSMGFPFDRRLQVKDLTELANTFTNMSMTDIVIRFNDVVVDKKN